MPDGGELTLSVVASAVDGRAGYVIAVRDDGVGMPPEVERRAFDPFFSTKGPGKGTGLGLAQVRALVDQQEGHVTLHTSPGAGTAVRLWLPSPSGAVEAAVVGAGNQRRRGRQERVLLVEDEVAVAEAVAAQLHDLGYEVVRAANGREALEVLESDDEVAVVLTDLSMPELDGEGLVRRLRRDRPGLPVVLTGAHAATDPALRDLDWLQKPYPSERLAQVIGEALAGRPR
jgi:CheY-like chemotaxis protein